GHREIEMENVSKPTMEEVSQIYDLANYLLSSGNVIQDGDTVGDVDDPIRVRYRPSVYDASRKAMTLSRD
ncbi:MAG TPA: DUF4261 domain-containing protein, partial [Terriglobales bacterium]|nr:DUF4261 domain-containing protein [Terriglobales bacterium]